MSNGAGTLQRCSFSDLFISMLAHSVGGGPPGLGDSFEDCFTPLKAVGPGSHLYRQMLAFESRDLAHEQYRPSGLGNSTFISSWSSQVFLNALHLCDIEAR